MLLPQSSLTVKSPVAAMLPIAIGDAPGLLTVIVFDADTVPTRASPSRSIASGDSTRRTIGRTSLSIHAASCPSDTDESFSYDHVSVCGPLVIGTATLPHVTLPDAPRPPLLAHDPCTFCCTPSIRKRKQS